MGVVDGVESMLWLAVIDAVEAKLSLWNEDDLVSRGGE
jgi:hypothetical protein